MSALRIGYSRSELAVMPYGEVIYDLAALNDGQERDETTPPDVTTATQEDIRSMLG